MGRTKKGTTMRKQPVRVTRSKAASKQLALTIRAPPRGQPKPRNSTTARATTSNSGGLPTPDPPRRTRSNTSTSATTSLAASSSSAALTQDDIPRIVHAVLNSLPPNHQTASGTQFTGEEDVEEVTEVLEDSTSGQR